MKNQSRNRKTIVLSVALGILLSMPLVTNAQYDENRFGLQQWGGSTSRNDQVRGDEEPQQPAPVGSGIAILMAAGAGYALLKKKADK